MTNSTKETLTDDAEVFGENAWVHCDSHGRPHTTGWCGVSPRKKTLLEATNYEDAVEECRARGLWLFRDKEEKAAAETRKTGA